MRVHPSDRVLCVQLPPMNIYNDQLETLHRPEQAVLKHTADSPPATSTQLQQAVTTHLNAVRPYNAEKHENSAPNNSNKKANGDDEWWGTVG
ncbi:hypothetical protein HDU81_010714 [Chytriomyces hyalinus]|nr:hypothetical protein HDU81_010714 [Chytriomyces hyalinus]